MNNELLAVLRLYLQESFNLQEKKKKKLSDKEIAALKPPKKKITQADILAMRGVFEEEEEELESVLSELISLSEKKRERKKASEVPGYAAGRNKEEKKQLNKDTERAQKAKGNLSSKEYERMDKSRQAEKSPKEKEKTPKNKYSDKIGMKKENLSRPKLRTILESLIENELEERKKRKKRKKRKSKPKSKSKSKSKSKKKKSLSKKTMDTLRRKAKASGYTAGSLASEYRKGLGAFYTSGSRKGMGAHQWAMARVNSAIGKGNPSWANLKRSKAKKK